MEVSDQLHSPGRFISTEGAPGTHWVGGRGDAMEKRKISFPSQELNPSRAVPCLFKHTALKMYGEAEVS
jgi:hypothetical protein